MRKAKKARQSGTVGVARHRQRMREAGFRPLQIWVPDTRSSKFAAECRRQSLLVATDPAERAFGETLESGLSDIPDWKA